jgi:hypothetical protein
MDKFSIKQFVHNAINTVWGLQGRIANRYGKSSYWISDILDERKEIDGFVYGYVLFMERVNELEPEVFAMIDDEVRRILDEMRATGIKGHVSESVDTLVEQIATTHARFLTAYRNRVGKGELKALAAKSSAQYGNLIQALDPPRCIPIGDEKRRVHR